MTTTTEPALAADPRADRVLWSIVPGLFFLVLILLVVATRWRAERPPLELLEKILDQPNNAVRVRALGLFQGRMRSELPLASDPEIVREVLRRTDRLLTQSTPREEAYFQSLPGLPTAQADVARSMLLGDRDYLQELLATLPCSLLPIGLPVLRELAEGQPAIEPLALAYRRRGALQALAALGESSQRAASLAPTEIDALVAHLEQVHEPGRIGDGLKTAARSLRGVRTGRPDLLGLDKTVALCAADVDPTLREGAALVARWWFGSATQNEAIDATLLKLLDDDGRGEDLREKLQVQPGVLPGTMPRSIQVRPGFLVRAYAVLALANRGSPRLPLDRLKELLDLETLKEQLLLEQPDGKREADQPRVLEVVTVALAATVQLRQKAPDRDLTSLIPAIEKLAAHPNPLIQRPAQAARLVLPEKAKP